MLRRATTTALLAGILALAFVARASAQTPPPAAPRAQTPEASAAAFVTKSRPMSDGVTMTADWYAADAAKKPKDARDVVVVCMHMARSSRGEYRAVAPELVRLGCSVLAVDLRSGGKRFDVDNETAKSATAGLGGSQGFAAAYGDVAFAVEWARELAPGARVVVLGSSFSSVLALRYAASPEGKADLVLAFSPGNYVDDWKTADDAKRARVMTLVACGSGAKEKENAEPIAKAVPEALRTTLFAPDEWKAPHGSPLLAMTEPKQRELAWAPVVKLIAELARR
jgi:dienelactone hydrolase